MLFYYKQNNLHKLLIIAKFIYNNVKNTNINYVFFEFNNYFYFYKLYQKILIFALYQN